METSQKPSTPARDLAEAPILLSERPHRKVDLHIPFSTYFKLVSCILVAWAACYLWPFVLLTLLAAMVAVTLDFFVCWLEKRGCKRWVALTAVIALFIVTVLGAIGWMIPTMVGQMADVVKKLPSYQEEFVRQLPGGENFQRQAAEYLKQMLNNPADSAAMGAIATQGKTLLFGLLQFLLVCVIAIYLLLDGRGFLRWFLAFFSQETRAKFSQTADEVSVVVSHYVAGQALTSAITFGFSYAVLLIFKVPAAFSLAILAGITDVIPILGFFIALVPAVLMALTVSPSTAVWVLGLYLLFNTVENYFIVPKVYGNRMRLSTLSVLMGLMVGGTLAGVPGAITVLPILASYAIIERVWLKDYLGSLVIRKHEIQEVQEYGAREHKDDNNLEKEKSTP